MSAAKDMKRYWRKHKRTVDDMSTKHEYLMCSTCASYRAKIYELEHADEYQQAFLRFIEVHNGSR